MTLLRLYSLTQSNHDPHVRARIAQRVEDRAARCRHGTVPQAQLQRQIIMLRRLVNTLALDKTPLLHTVPRFRALLLHLLQAMPPLLSSKDLVLFLSDCRQLGLRHTLPSDVVTVNVLAQTVLSRVDYRHTTQPMLASHLCSAILSLALMEYSPTQQQLNTLCHGVSRHVHKVTSPHLLTKLLMGLSGLGMWPSNLRIVPTLERWLTLEATVGTTPNDAVHIVRAVKGLLLARCIDPGEKAVSLVMASLYNVLVKHLPHVHDQHLCEALVSLAHIRDKCGTGVINAKALWPVLHGRLPRLVHAPTHQQVVDLLWAVPTLVQGAAATGVVEPYQRCVLVVMVVVIRIVGCCSRCMHRLITSSSHSLLEHAATLQPGTDTRPDTSPFLVASSAVSGCASLHLQPSQEHVHGMMDRAMHVATANPTHRCIKSIISLLHACYVVRVPPSLGHVEWMLHMLQHCTTDLQGLGTALAAVAGMHVADPAALLQLRPSMLVLLDMVAREFATAPDHVLATKLQRVDSVYAVHDAAGGSVVPLQLMETCRLVLQAHTFTKHVIQRQPKRWAHTADRIYAVACRMHKRLGVFTSVERRKPVLHFMRPLDVLCTLPDGRWLVLERTEPGDYFVNKTGELMGPRMLRTELLQQLLGAAVVHVRLKRSDAFDDDDDKVVKALAAALAEVGVSVDVAALQPRREGTEGREDPVEAAM